jgi:hypothetical protein
LGSAQPFCGAERYLHFSFETTGASHPQTVSVWGSWVAANAEPSHAQAWGGVEIVGEVVGEAVTQLSFSSQ